MNKAETRADLVELHLPIPGNERMVMIAIDRDLVRSVNTHKLTLIGGVGPLHVAVDRYASAGEGDGEECYVRVLDLTAEEERWHLLAQSTTLGHAVVEPLISWGEDQRSFTVHLAGRPSLRVELSVDGEVTVGAIVDRALLS